MANKKEEGKAVSAPVSYAGDSIQRNLFWIGLLLIPLGLMKNCSANRNTANEQLVTCEGVPPELSPASPLLTVRLNGINHSCYSMVFVAPSANSAVRIIANGTVDVCFWKDNRCVAWAHQKNNSLVEVTRSDIPKKNYPEYSAILIKGDSGDAVIRLSR